MVVIIDYNMGNLRSVLNAFKAVGTEARVTRNPADLQEALGIVLPGVGAFGDGIRNLKAAGFIDALEEVVRHRKRPFLGLCLGLQLLATRGLEHGEHPGLDWIPGLVDRISAPPGIPPLRVPHIGWNDVRFLKNDGLYAGLGDSQDFYFVHSYRLVPRDRSAISGLCSYGVEIVASVEQDNLCATQFHPEKSHRMGLAVIRNWCARVARC